MRTRQFLSRSLGLLLLPAATLLGLACYWAGGSSATELTRAVRSGELLRLHILADSDEEKAQADKLLVRDAVLEALAPLLEGADSAQEAETLVQDNLAMVEAVARQTLQAQGESYPVEAEILTAHFPDRVYLDHLVPEGEYRALQIRLGSAQGHNWWCVLYPPLCFVGEDCVELDEVRFESKIASWIRTWLAKGEVTKE